MSAAMALGGFTGPEADTLGYAIRKKKSAVLRAQKEKFVTQAAERGVAARRHRRGLQGLRAVRAVRLQQGPRHLLRADRLPDRVPQGQPHGRLHDRGADRLPVERGEGRRRGRRVPPDGDRGPAAGRPPQPPRVHRRGRRHPVRPAGGQERRPGRDRIDHRGARGGRRVPLADRLLHADRPPAGQPEGARGAGQGRARSTRSGIRPRSCSGSTTPSPPRRRPSATGSPARPRCSTSAPPTRRPSSARCPPRPRCPVRERLRWEKELLGLYLSEHPMGEVAEQVGQFVTAYSSDLRDESLDGQRVVVGGIVTGVRTVITKAKATMAIVTWRTSRARSRSWSSRGCTSRPGPTWRDGRDPAGRRPGRPQGRGDLAARRPRGRLGRRVGGRSGGVRAAGRGRRPGSGRRRRRATATATGTATARGSAAGSGTAARPGNSGSGPAGCGPVPPAAVGSGAARGGPPARPHRARRSCRTSPRSGRRARRSSTCRRSPRPSRSRPTSTRPGGPQAVGRARRVAAGPGRGARPDRRPTRRPTPRPTPARTPCSTSGSRARAPTRPRGRGDGDVQGGAARPARRDPGGHPRARARRRRHAADGAASRRRLRRRAAGRGPAATRRRPGRAAPQPDRRASRPVSRRR